ncbi:MAG: FEA1-related lipoprotein [Candidatus Thalassarchaeum sp.]|nr:FEA1-related lipoprotein [Candidatus Thalassarchaeum sp.]
MNNGKMKGMTLALLMMMAAFAGCLGGDDADDAADEVSAMDASDAGYTYASNVDNHRSLMKDLCDMKAAASSDGGYDFTTAKDIYMNGKNAEKSDGTFRTLHGFASAEGKKHPYDDYYNMTGSVGAHIMDAMDGTGDFAGTSDTVRYQGIAKLTVNMGMVAYTIHELNSAIAKADAGNIDNDTGAPHNWDEGWAFFHGPDEDYSCSPAKVMEKRAGDFGTTNADGVANTFSATEAAMVDGLAALQAGDAAGYTAAADTVVKNLVITYSQAVLKYTYKMDSNTTAEKYQAEGYAFWMAIEALVADHTDACYNNQTHVMAWIGAGNASNCDAFIWTQYQGQGDYMCYNTDLHIVYQAATNETQCDGFASVFPESGMPGYYADHGANEMNKILDLTDASQLGTSYDVGPWLTGAWAHYGITSADIGTLQ